MKNPEIHTIDLNFRGKGGTIGVYLIPHNKGCILIETGPSSTINALISGLEIHGYKIKDITDVFLTHIHLDHAGAAGYLAKNGARIHVHENGAPHLLNPERLLASASRLYGDMMNTLWGEVLPVHNDQLLIVQDQDIYRVNNLSILAIDSPGHANHHLVYLIGDACFSGDVCGIRLTPTSYLCLPMPPPDLHIEKWRSSIQRIQQLKPKRLIPTHFGIYPDARWHLQAVLDTLDDVETWMEQKLTQDLPLEILRQLYVEFEQLRAEKLHIDRASIESHQIANPSFMSADGILRYWNKYRKSV
jgi:glyoxylase-like metal-dependent hydrolase (beta-lactamase superfamily II)